MERGGGGEDCVVVVTGSSSARSSSGGAAARSGGGGGGSSASAVLGGGSMHALSVANGSLVASLRGGGAGAPPGCVAVMQDGRRVAAVAAKATASTGSSHEGSSSAVFIWEWGKEQPIIRSFSPCKISVLLQPGRQHCNSSSGHGFPLLIAGAANGSLLIWEVCTGKLLKIWQAHYRAVSALCLSPDGSILLSGGQDGVVHSWPIIHAIRPAASAVRMAKTSTSQQHQQHQHQGTETSNFLSDSNVGVRPLHSWSHHTMPVTSIVSGVQGSGGGGLVITASLDCSIKLYSLAQGSLLRTEKFGHAVTALEIDSSETAVYAGCSDGSVWQVNLNCTAHDVIASVHSDANTIRKSSSGGTTSHSTKSVIQGTTHKRFVTALALNMMGTLLISASDDGALHFCDTYTLQSTRTMNFTLPLTNLFFTSSIWSTLKTKQKSNEFAGIAPLAKHMQSQVQNLKSWEDTYFVLPKDSYAIDDYNQNDIIKYKEDHDDFDNDDDDSMTLDLCTYSILQRMTGDDYFSEHKNRNTMESDFENKGEDDYHAFDDIHEQVIPIYS